VGRIGSGRHWARSRLQPNDGNGCFFALNINCNSAVSVGIKGDIYDKTWNGIMSNRAGLVDHYITATRIEICRISIDRTLRY